MDISHNSDGTKSIWVGAKIDINSPLSSSLQGFTVNLTTIPRASQPSLSASSVTMGNSVTVYTNRVSSNFTHVLYYQIGSGSWNTIATNIATSYSWTVPTSLASSTPNNTNLSLNMILETYNSGSHIGTKSVGLTTVVPSTVVPTINSVTLTEVNQAISSKFGGFVQSKSKISGNVSASGASGSTIKSFSSKINGQTLTTVPFATNELTSSGSQNADVTVTDSRGRTANKKEAFNVLAYSNPTITTFTVFRANSSGVFDDKGDNVLCSINASISSVNNLNDKSFVIKYKKSADSSYTNINITPTSEFFFNGTYLVPNIDIDFEYEFILELADYFGVTTSEKKFIPTAFTLMDFHASGKAMSIGKVSTSNNTFEVDINTVFKKIVDGIYPVGSIYMSVSSVNPAAFFGGSWEQLQNRFLLGAGSSYSAGATGGNASISIATDNIPGHTHSVSITTSNTGSHTHGLPRNNSGSAYREALGYTTSATRAQTTETDSAGGHTHSVSGNTGSSGSGTAFNILPPYLVVYIWKRTT